MADARGGVPVEDVARYPLPGTAVPVAAAFSADGRWVTYLHSPDRSLRRELFVMDAETGEARSLLGRAPSEVTEQTLTLDEKLRRERARELGVGVTSYAWVKETGSILVPLAGGLWVLDDVTDAEPRLVVGGEAIDPQVSPDGTRVAFVREAEVWVAPLDGSAAPQPLTRDAVANGRTAGLAEFVAQEEMARSHGFWWSQDSRSIAFAEVDERHIPVYRIVHQGSDQVGEGAQEDHRYPFAGADNAKVRLGVIATDGAVDGSSAPEPVWMDLPPHEYLARVHWLADGALVAQVEDRSQCRLDVVRLDPRDGTSTVLWTETSDVWINLHDCFRPLDDGRLLWASERSGYLHLELRRADGSLDVGLTSGDWLVTGVTGVDEDQGLVWFTATADSPLERHLYEVSLAGGSARRVTQEEGTHAVVVHPKSGRFVDTWSSRSTPPAVFLRDLSDGTVLAPVSPGSDPRLARMAIAPPELTSIETADGTELHVALYRPDGEGPFPTVVSVYGGPHAQRVTDSWATTVVMRNQYLRTLGFLVVMADNRGSANRGLAFEGAIRHDLGHLEVEDQAEVIAALTDRGLIDPTRVGIYGWSYGGYMSAMCLARRPDVFHVAVAGAPVTHWDGYDTHYTERYMGTPQDNPDGYRRSSVMAHVEAITGRLLLVHGLIDENVHFRHTARLLNALIRAGVHAELLLFPDERHVPRAEADRISMERRISDFLTTHLLAP